MLENDTKIWIIAGLFLALVVAKLLAGGRPFDTPVRRRRRFGYRGTEGPLARARAGLAKGGPVPEAAPEDPEKAFFGDDSEAEGDERHGGNEAEDGAKRDDGKANAGGADGGTKGTS
jgi:hypothetical protein